MVRARPPHSSRQTLRSARRFRRAPVPNRRGKTTHIKARVSRVRDLAEDTCGSDLLLLFRALLVAGHLRQPLLERDGEGNDEIARIMFVDPCFDLGKPLVLLPDVVALRQVDEVSDGPGRE